MLAVTLQIVVSVLGIAMLLALVRVVRGPSLPDRVVALDLCAVLGVGMMAALSVLHDSKALLDVALIVALVAFLGTVALGRYLERSA